MATRIGVDVGGTFTDLIYYDDETGEMRVGKEPTTPAAPEQGVHRRGPSDARRRRARPRPRYFLHGTTVGLELAPHADRRGRRAALHAGFRDILETRRGDRDEPYNLFWRPPDAARPAPPAARRSPSACGPTATVHVPFEADDVRRGGRGLRGRGRRPRSRSRS